MPNVSAFDILSFFRRIWQGKEKLEAKLLKVLAQSQVCNVCLLHCYIEAHCTQNQTAKSILFALRLKKSAFRCSAKQLSCWIAIAALDVVILKSYFQERLRRLPLPKVRAALMEVPDIIWSF